MSSRRPPQSRPALFVEELESRQLSSVMLKPHFISIDSVREGNGVVKINIPNQLIAGGVPVVVEQERGPPYTPFLFFAFAIGMYVEPRGATQLKDVDGDGHLDVRLIFRRSELRPLLASRQDRLEVTISVFADSLCNACDQYPLGSDTLVVRKRQ